MSIRAYATDIGNKKSVNQDSLIIKRAFVDKKEVILLAVCDGMGGLSNGELASAEAVKSLDNWFKKEMPNLMSKGISDKSLKDSLIPVIQKANDEISRYGEQNHVECGTTIAAIFLFNGHYATLNVGDSRVYKITGDEIQQLTKDQTVVQDLLDKGMITPQEVDKHPQRSILLQCVGVGEDVSPEFTFGRYQRGDVFLVCSDGFRHKITDKEILTLFHSSNITDKEALDERVKYAVEVNKTRGEKDNITAICCYI